MQFKMFSSPSSSKLVPDSSLSLEGMDGVLLSPHTGIKNEPYDLPEGFKWCTCDLADGDCCLSVSGLLSNENKNSPQESWFIFTTEYLRWSCCPPEYLPGLHIGITDGSIVLGENTRSFSRRIIAFIAAVPIRVRVVNKSSRTAWIRLPVVHHHYRSQISIDVLYAEAIRRVRRENFERIILQKETHQAAPMAYLVWQRPVSLNRLVRLGLLQIPGLTPPMMKKYFKLSDSPKIPGLQKMTASHIWALTGRLREYFEQFSIAPDFNEADVRHWFLSNPSELRSYIVVEPNGSITGLCSFLIMGQVKNATFMKFAHSYYNFSVGIPLWKLMKYAFIYAKANDCEAFFACDAMGNDSFLRELNFFPHGSYIQYDLGLDGLGVLNKDDMGLVLL